MPGLLAILAVLLTAVAFLHSRRTSLDSIKDGTQRRVAAFGQMTVAVVRISTEENHPEIVRQYFDSLSGVPNLRLAMVFNSVEGILYQVRHTNLVEASAQILAANGPRIEKVGDTGERIVEIEPAGDRVTGVFSYSSQCSSRCEVVRARRV